MAGRSHADPVDEIDLDILNLLEEDCSISYKDIANRLNKNIWTVRDRVVLLKRRGIIKACRAEIDYAKIGLGCRAIVESNVPSGMVEDFTKFARKEKRIVSLTITSGSKRFSLEIVGEECSEIRKYALNFLTSFGVDDFDFKVVLEKYP